MATNSQARLGLGLDSCESDCKDTAIKRVFAFDSEKGTCLHAQGGLSCLCIPQDGNGKQLTDHCLRKLAGSLENTMNAATHSARPNIRSKVPLMPDMGLWCQAGHQNHYTRQQELDFALGCECEPAYYSGNVPPDTDKECANEYSDFLKKQQLSRLNCDCALKDTWNSGNVDNFVTRACEENDSDNDVMDVIPQFDGASDKIPGSIKKSNKSQIADNALSQNTGEDSLQSETTGIDLNVPSASDLASRSGPTAGGLGNTQSYSSGSWAHQGWPQQAGSGSGPWHGQSQTWTQQQHYESWPQQRMPSTFPSQQAPFRSPSPAASFQSPSHNPYASPTHQQTFQTPSQRQYHYPPYQSPPSSQSYQQPYQSPSQHPYQSPRPSQTFHSPESYNPSSPYQSPSNSHTLQPLGANCQPYQSPTSSKPYTSSTGSQPYRPQSAGLPYPSPSAGHPYQQPATLQMYPSTFQSSSQSRQTTHTQQTYPQQPYKSPAQEGCYPSQPAWSPQAYSGYSQMSSSREVGPHINSEKSLAESSQPGPVFGPSITTTSDGFNSFLPSQQAHQQEQTDEAISALSVVTSGPEAQSNQFDISQTTGSTNKKGSAEAVELQSSQSPCLTPPAVTQSPLEVKPSSISTPPLTCELRYSHTKDGINGPQIATVDIKSIVTPRNIRSDASPVTNISTLEFRPNIASVNKEPSMDKCTQLLLNSATSPRASTEKGGKTTSTPMIQQLLMEEPARMKIRKEDRDAVIKKPMASPVPPKPKRKYKTRVKQSGKTPGRPRSTSVSSPMTPAMGYCGYSPQPVMNPHIVGRPGRSHSISLPFSCESRMPSPMHNYGWQQWKQQSFPPPSSPWREQLQWGISDWQNFDGSREPSCSTAEISNLSAQHRSFNASSASQSPICQDNLQSNQLLSFSCNQSALQNNSSHGLQLSTDSSHTCSSRESFNDRSSLSSLFQLISDVGSDDTGWENAPVPAMPTLFSSSSDSEAPTPIPVSDLNHESPPAKDFITLVTPCKQQRDKASSDIAGMTSSEESDRMDLDLSCDLKHRTLNRPHSLGSILPRVGKLNRLKKLGILPTRNTKFGSIAYSAESNPAYTYTFHVPTTVFKKLKFFRSSESRKHNFTVVRMHPMDARRYSLLKIGREIVKAVKLTEIDLANYNVTIPPPSHFASVDGCTNRVNLDIPIFSAERPTIDGSESIIFSQFDTDFPPNKVAPPSSFCASQINASMARNSSTANHRSSVGSNRMWQDTIHQPANYNGRISPESQQEGSFSVHQGPLLQQDGANRQFGSGLHEDASSNPVLQYNQNGNSSCAYSTPPSIQENNYPNQQGIYMNQLQHPQQQQYQERSSSSHLDPKNGLRSPGQHGLTSRIESGRVHDDGDDQQEMEIDGNTTSSSHFNTRVNAQIQNNHAEHMASYTASQHTSVPSKRKSPCNICTQQSDGANNLYDKLDVYKQIQPRSRAHLHLFSPDCEDSLSKKGHDDHNDKVADKGCAVGRYSYNCEKNLSNGHNDEMTNNKCDVGNEDDVSKQPAQLTSLNKHNINNQFILQHNKLRGRLSSRKNIKALSLTIPKPQSNLSLLRVGAVRRSSHCVESDSALSSQKESDDHDDDEEDINSTNNVSAFRRSTRSCRRGDGKKYVAGDRRGKRLAKMLSVYSKCSHSLKPKKRRRKQGPLIEGFHYIVVGKFKGCQAMQVKVRKLSVNPTERVRAEDFEKLAAKDIVRLISPMNSLKGRMYNEELEHAQSLSSATESQSDAETYQPHFGYGNHEFDQQAVLLKPRSCHRASRGRLGQRVKFRSATRGCHKASRGRLGQHVKFRSAHVSSSKQQVHMLTETSQQNFLQNESKNVLAGLTSGASQNNVQASYFIEDKFFARFKESFIKHYKVKEQAVVDFEVRDPKNIFFRGIRRASFHHFQQKFKANVEKLSSADYSSSSDDEDDVLDDTILKEKIYETQKFVTSQVASKDISIKLVKHGHIIAESGLWAGHLTVSDAADSLAVRCVRSGLKLNSTEPSENCPENKWDQLEEQNCCIGNDDALSSCEEWRASHSHVLEQTIERKNMSQIVTNSGGHSLENKDKNSEVSIILVPKNMEQSVIEERNIHHSSCFESSMSCSVKDSDILKDEENTDDYLKCQMAFFEDISSDSDSNDTIIGDNCIRKKNVFNRHPANLYPFTLSYPLKFDTGSANPVKCDTSSANTVEFDTSSTNPVKFDTSSANLAKFDTSLNPVKFDTSSTIKDVPTQDSHSGLPDACRSSEQNVKPLSGLASDHANLSQICASHNSQSDVCINLPNFGRPSHALDICVEQLSEISAPEFSKENLEVSDEQKGSSSFVSVNNLLPVEDLSHVSEDAMVAQGVSVSDLIVSKCEVKNTHRVLHPSGNVVIDQWRNSCRTTEMTRVFEETTSLGQKRHRKDVKKSKVKVDRSKLAKIRSSLDNVNEETSISPESLTCGRNRYLSRRKKTRYVCATEGLDSSDSSEEDYTSRVSLQNRKSIGGGSRKRRIRKLPQVRVDAERSSRGGHEARPAHGKRKKLPGRDKLLDSLSLLHMATLASVDTERDTRTGHGGSPSRGKRKKPTSGAGKLLNSLSLLHMATLASLTEAQSDPPDDSQSETISHPENEYSLHAPDRFSDYSSTHGLQFSTSSAPSSSSDTRRWKHTRSRSSLRVDPPSHNHLNFSQNLTNLKPGCNGVSNLSSKPLPFSRIVNNCTSFSPFPPNAALNSSNGSTHQPDSANLLEDAGTYNTLQLLETRRAQVNCASFSMKDILKLTTPADFTAVPVTPPKRAQVKSTTLSMSDILQLTNADNRCITEESQVTTNSLLCHLSNPSCAKFYKNVDKLDAQVSLPRSQTPLEEALAASGNELQTADFSSTSCQKQMTALEMLTCSGPPNLPSETTEASQSLLSQLANFQNSPLAEEPRTQPALILAEVNKPQITYANEEVLIRPTLILAEAKKPQISASEELHVQSVSPLAEKKISQIASGNAFVKYARVKSTSLSVSSMHMDTSSRDSNDDVNNQRESLCLSNMTNKPHRDLQTTQIPVDLIKRCHWKMEDNNITTSIAAFPVLGRNLDILSSPISSHNVVRESSPSHNVVREPSPSSHNVVREPSPSSHNVVREPPPPYHNVVREPSIYQNVVREPSPSHNVVREPSPSSHNVVREPSPSHNVVRGPSPSSHNVVRAPSSHNVVRELSPSSHNVVREPSTSSHNVVRESSSSSHVVRKSSTSFHNAVRDPSTCTSSSPHSLSQENLKHFESSSDNQQIKKVDSENVDGVDKTTIRTTLQTTMGNKSAPTSIKTTNVESCSARPSQDHLQSSVSETPDSPTMAIVRISVTSDGPHETLNCTSSVLQSSTSKQEKANHKSLNDKNVEGEMKPLHAQQIFPYHGLTSPLEQAHHRSSSLYYPYCWQWPVHTPGSDPAVSPLNLCTTQKSPNNYSPITPTSPISPNYPTQAQGVAESDISPPVKAGKSLWHPWLKTGTDTKACSASPGDNTRSLPYKTQHTRNTRTPSTFPGKLSDQELSSDNNTRKMPELQKQHSPGRYRSQLSISKPGFQRMNDLLTKSGLVSHFVAAVSGRTDIGHLLPAKYSEGLGEDNQLSSESISVTTLDGKQRPRLRKNGGQGNFTDSYWSGDTAITPDSLDSYQGNCSRYKSFVSHVDDKIQRIPEATEKRRKFYSKGLYATDMFGGDHEEERLKPKNMRKSKLSTSVNANHSSDKLKYFFHQGTSETATSGSKKILPAFDQKWNSKMLNREPHSLAEKRGRDANNMDCDSCVDGQLASESI